MDCLQAVRATGADDVHGGLCFVFVLYVPNEVEVAWWMCDLKESRYTLHLSVDTQNSIRMHVVDPLSMMQLTILLLHGGHLNSFVSILRVEEEARYNTYSRSRLHKIILLLKSEFQPCEEKR